MSKVDTGYRDINKRPILDGDIVRGLADVGWFEGKVFGQRGSLGFDVWRAQCLLDSGWRPFLTELKNVEVLT